MDRNQPIFCECDNWAIVVRTDGTCVCPDPKPIFSNHDTRTVGDREKRTHLECEKSCREESRPMGEREGMEFLEGQDHNAYPKSSEWHSENKLTCEHTGGKRFDNLRM